MNLIYRDDDIVIFLRRCLFLVKFGCWSKFHFNIFTGSGVMTTSVNKGLTRNLEIPNISSEFCTIYRDSGELGIPNFGTNATAEMVTECCKMPGLQLLLFLSC